MAKVTSKLQLTIPKVIADRYGIRPGMEIDLAPTGEVIRMTPLRHGTGMGTVAERLRTFDQATERLRHKQRGRRRGKEPARRGWTREELYQRGRSR